MEAPRVKRVLHFVFSAQRIVEANSKMPYTAIVTFVSIGQPIISQEGKDGRRCARPTKRPTSFAGPVQCFLTLDRAPGHQNNSSSAMAKRQAIGTKVKMLSSNRRVKSRPPLHGAAEGPKVSSRSQCDMLSSWGSESKHAGLRDRAHIWRCVKSKDTLVIRRGKHSDVEAEVGVVYCAAICTAQCIQSLAGRSEPM